MFFLLRVAFWLTIVLALLPSGNRQTNASGPQIGEAVSAAGAAVSDARHFCARQPEACEVGSQTAIMIGQRAQAGAKMLIEILNEHTGSSGNAPAQDAKPSSGTGTLTSTDRAPVWHGTERRKEHKPAS